MKLPNILYKISVFFEITKAYKALEYPVRIDLGLTNFCNSNCSFCVNDKINKKRGFMSESFFQSIIDCVEKKFYSKTVVGLELFDESLLHPKFVDFLEYASNHNVKMSMASNFISLSEEITKAILNSKINLMEISLYTLNKDRYSKIMGQDKYNLVLKNIHMFLSMAKDNNFKGKIRLRPMEDFSEETDAYKKEFYDQYRNLNFELKIPKKKRNWAGCLDLKWSMKEIYMRVPCSIPFRRMSVDWDGEVKICHQAMLSKDLNIGYIDENYTPFDLWNGREIKKIRKKFLKLDYSLFPSCRKCYDSRKYLSFSNFFKIFKPSRIFSYIKILIGNN